MMGWILESILHILLKCGIAHVGYVELLVINFREDVSESALGVDMLAAGGGIVP